MIKRHWGILAGILLVCAVAYADSVGRFDALKLRPAALPSVGKDGELRVDSADSNKLKKYSESATAWEEISGGGGGAGGVTYWSDFQADDITKVKEDSDYTTYAGTPDAVATNLTITSETTNPLSGDASYLLTKAAAVATNEAWILPLENPDDATSRTLDRLCKVAGQTAYVNFKYETSANYDNSADERILVYTFGDSSGLQACSARSTLSGTFSNQLPIAPDGGQYVCPFTCGASDTAIDAVIAYSGTAANLVEITMDEVKISPQSVIQAPIVTEWQQFTDGCGGDWVSGATYTCYFKRTGDSIDLEYQIDISGGVTATSLTVDLPTGLTIDTSKKPVTNSWSFEGGGVAQDTGATQFRAIASYKSINDLYVNYILNNTGTSITTARIDATAPVTWGSTDLITLKVLNIPITEFANSSAILSSTQVDHQTVTAKYKGDPASTTLNTPIIAPTLVEDDFGAYSTSTGLFTSPGGGRVQVFGVVVSACSGGIALNLYKNGSSADTPTGYLDSNGEATFVGYVEDVSAGDTISIRPSATCDFQAIRLQFVHIPDFSTFGVYGVDQPLSAVSSTKTPGTTGDYLQMTGNSIALDPGDWLVTPSINANNSGSNPSYEYISLDLYGANGADTSGQPVGVDTLAGASYIYTKMVTPALLIDPNTGASLSNHRGAGVPQRIRLTQSQTIYAVPQIFAGTVANARVFVRITAERIK